MMKTTNPVAIENTDFMKNLTLENDTLVSFDATGALMTNQNEPYMMYFMYIGFEEALGYPRPLFTIS